MKRLICFTLCFLLLITGCAHKDTVNFYYLRDSFQYGTHDGVIVAENRDITGHKEHISFLLSLYLMGPQNEGNVTPFSVSARLLSVERKMNGLVITLTDTQDTLTDAEYVLACACMTLTCLEILPIESVTINSGERSQTLSREILTLYDSETATESTDGG